MPNTALITGASSGIGTGFARYHASQGGDVILTARREDTLNALKTELEAKYGITAHVFAMDLGAPGGADALYDAVKAAGLPVDILINNAGFGAIDRFMESDLATQQGIIDLNVKALVTLTHRFGQDMVAQGSGKILNVGSTAGFMPGPRQAIYFASKAFVNSFSQAVSHELRHTGVSCTVLAPGYVETEFAKVADMEGTALATNGATPEAVAKHGYDAMMQGKLLTINDPKLRFMLNWITPLLPRRTVLKMVSKMQAK
ncbi:MAG: SDR family oxidoreductase [Mangrovicoccus sp.]|nr:SDR family oxidoreductase [Mangrovicoccus sp.]